MHMMTEHPEPIEVGGPVLAGWESVIPLNEAERDCLYLLVLSRFCQSLTLSRHTVKLHPENAEYLMITSKRGVNIFRHLWELGKEKVEKLWFQSAAQFSHRKWERCEENHSLMYQLNRMIPLTWFSAIILRQRINNNVLWFKDKIIQTYWSRNTAVCLTGEVEWKTYVWANANWKKKSI